MTAPMLRSTMRTVARAAERAFGGADSGSGGNRAMARVCKGRPWPGSSHRGSSMSANRGNETGRAGVQEIMRSGEALPGGLATALRAMAGRAGRQPR
jgi:hypothetical protein